MDMLGQFFPITDPVLIFAALLMISLLAPPLFVRLKMPGTIGLIAAGIVLGPHALGILDRGPEVQLLGKIGLLYIMFLAGLELDLVEFLRHRGHSAAFGMLTFAIPLLLGSLTARFLLPGFNWPAAVLLASMFSSHTLLTYPIASRLGLSRTRAVTTTIGGTIITDTLALLILAVIAASHQGESGAFFWLRLFLFMAVYIAAAALILPLVGKWFFRRAAGDGVTAFIGVMGALFLCAYFAETAGLEPIIGAFLAGLVLNSLIPEKSALMNRIQFVGNSLFIPFFMVSVGMLVHLRLLFESPEAWEVAGAMVLAGFATKWLAAAVTAKWLNFTGDEGMLIFGLSVNQAAATLAAVMVGYEIGIFGEAVLTGTIMMILFTCLGGSWITERYARRVALREEEKPYDPATAPHRILVPLANPATAEALMDLALLLRRKDSQEPLFPLTVARAGINAAERIAAGEKLLGHAVVRAVAAGVSAVPVTRSAMDIPSGIAQALLDLRISTVIAGWDGKISSRHRVFGSVLDSVIRDNPQMMIVSRCRAPINTMSRVILALPPLSERQSGFGIALRAVKTLTGQIGAALLTVSVPETLGKTRKVLAGIPPAVKESAHELGGWNDFLPWAAEALGKSDLLVLLGVRPGRLGWQPALDRLPRLLGRDLAGINFLVIHPPEMPWQEEEDSGKMEGTDFCSVFLPPDHVQIRMNRSDPAGAIALLLGPAFPGRPEAAARLAGVLSGIAVSDPVEMAPGAVLLHAHVPEVFAYTVFLGVNPEGWILPHTSAPVRALFLLLSPQGAPPESHLRVLAELAKHLHRPGIADELVKAASVPEILEILS